jgi:hypothetical protein
LRSRADQLRVVRCRADAGAVAAGAEPEARWRVAVHSVASSVRSHECAVSKVVRWVADGLIEGVEVDDLFVVVWRFVVARHTRQRRVIARSAELRVPVVNTGVDNRNVQPLAFEAVDFRARRFGVCAGVDRTKFLRSAIDGSTAIGGIRLCAEAVIDRFIEVEGRCCGSLTLLTSGCARRRSMSAVAT